MNSIARKRLLELFDNGSFVEFGRLVRDHETPSGVVTGYGTIDGSPAYAFAQDGEVVGGGLGQIQAKKICKMYDLASQNGNPIVGVFDSGGIKLNEGMDSMEGLSAILAKSNAISGVVPQISLIIGPCVGSASIVANNADITVLLDGADYYLNPGDDNAVADVEVASEVDALNAVRKLVEMLPSNNLDVAGNKICEDVTSVEFTSVAGGIDSICDSDALIIGKGENTTAFAYVGGIVCGIIGISEEKVAQLEGARIARFVRLCDCFSIPIVTLMDSAGFACLDGASKVSHAYTETATIKITLIVGKAYGSAYIAVASEMTGADVVYALPTATILPLAPEAAIHVFWGDRLKDMKNPVEERKQLAIEFAQTEGDVFNVAGGGFVTDVIEPAKVKACVVSALEMFSGKRVIKMPKKHSNIRI